MGFVNQVDFVITGGTGGHRDHNIAKTNWRSYKFSVLPSFIEGCINLSVDILCIYIYI